MPLCAAVWLALFVAGQATDRDPSILLRAQVVGLIVMAIWGASVMASGTVQTASDFLWNVVVRGGLAGGLAMALSRVVLIGGALAWNGSSSGGLHGFLQRRRESLQMQNHQPVFRDYSAEAAESKAQKERDEKKKKADEQKIADMKFAIILEFEEQRQKLESFLTRDRLDGLLKEYFAKDQPLATVKARCKQLQTIIGGLTSVVPEADDEAAKVGFTSMDEILAHFSEQKAAVNQQASLDDCMRDVLLDSIDESEQAAFSNFLRRV